MAKSRKRKGHAARVAKRNAEILNEKKRQQKYFQKMMQQYQDELQKQMDEQTEDFIDATEENAEDTTGLTHIDGQKDLPHSKEYWSPDGDIIDTVIPESEDTK